MHPARDLRRRTVASREARRSVLALRLAAIAAIALLVLAVAASVRLPQLGGPGEAAERDENGLIAFVRSRGRAAELFTVDVPAGAVRALTHGPGTASTPAWSPDGQQLAYAWRDPSAGGYRIRITSAAGEHQRFLTDGAAIDGSPTWSPRGDRIAFASNRDGRRFAIFAIDIDGSGLVRLADGHSPTWSPRGDLIAFVRTVDDAHDVFTMRPDGSDIRNVTGHAADDVDPAWYPDGRSLVFASDRDGDFDLYRIALDDRSPLPLTTGQGHDRTPAVSPDGRLLVFSRTGAGSADLWWIDESLLARRLTDDALFDLAPSWQPLPG